jgi:hypothetical protein
MTTNLNLRYTSRYHQFEDSLVNERVDGVSYDVYNKVTYRAALNVNLNVQADLMRTKYGTLTADLRLGNILNLIPSKEHASTTYPYQYGRQAWAGLQYTF